jgi:hypothetical protein
MNVTKITNELYLWLHYPRMSVSVRLPVRHTRLLVDILDSANIMRKG